MTSVDNDSFPQPVERTEPVSAGPAIGWFAGDQRHPALAARFSSCSLSSSSSFTAAQPAFININNLVRASCRRSPSLPSSAPASR